MNKKSVGIVEIIIWLGLAAFVGFVLLNFFGKTSKEAGTLFSSETLKAKDSKCLFDTERAAKGGMKIDKINDQDSDGRLDACDICVNGKNEEDNDLDGMPTHCDKNDNDRTIVTCARTITKDGRCID